MISSPLQQREQKISKVKSRIVNDPAETKSSKENKKQSLMISGISAKDKQDAGPSHLGSRKVSFIEVLNMEQGQSDCEIVEDTDAMSEIAETVKIRMDRKKKLDGNKGSEDSLDDFSIRQSIQEDDMDDLMTLSASTVATRAFEWLTTIDELRSRSRNLQGSVSGGMKRNLVMVKRAVTVLFARVNAVPPDERHVDVVGGLTPDS